MLTGIPHNCNMGSHRRQVINPYVFIGFLHRPCTTSTTRIPASSTQDPHQLQPANDQPEKAQPPEQMLQLSLLRSPTAPAELHLHQLSLLLHRQPQLQQVGSRKLMDQEPEEQILRLLISSALREDITLQLKQLLTRSQTAIFKEPI